MDNAVLNQEVVAVRGVKVAFGAVKALDGADLVIRSGECVGLVGHNGAGKSTIVNVINGALSPQQGTLAYGGDTASPGIARARANGVRCVFQELSLCPNLTIAENARIMHGDLGGGRWRRRGIDLVSKQLSDIFPDHRIDCASVVEDLSIAERQMVEIAINFAAVSAAPRLVILDEPTSSLDAALAGQLMAYVRRFVGSGGSVLLISHILGEILSTSDRIVVMKDGKVVADRAAREFDTRRLVETMGSVVRERAERRVFGRERRTPILSVPAASASDTRFEAFEGEIIGLAGLGGHGQTEALLDLYLSANSNWLPVREPKMAFVAGDRGLNGTFPLWSILKNLSISSLKTLSSRNLIDAEQEDRVSEGWKKRIEIRTPNMHNPILSLSGGNQQKVVLGKWLLTNPKVLFLDEPTRGIDVGAKQEIYAEINKLAKEGMAIVLVSSELPEVLGLSDRVLVLHEGRMTGEFARTEATPERVMAAATGHH